MNPKYFPRVPHAYAVILLMLIVSCSLKDDNRESGIIDETENIVSGQVVDMQGEPIEGATVSLYGASASPSSSQSLLAKTAASQTEGNHVEAQTDKDGRYRIRSTISKKAYLQVSWRDSLGLLDSMDFSQNDEIDLGKQSLQEKGKASIVAAGLEAGTLIWVPSLNVEITVQESDSVLTIPAPPCVLVFIVLVKNEQVGSIEDISIEPGEETEVELPADLYTKFIDSRDQKVYSLVKIGTQVWMAENLNFGTMVTTPSVLLANGEKYCQGDIDSNCLLYGGLYQWHTAMNLPDSCADRSCEDLVSSTHQGICPQGWHIPDQSEIDLLASNLGGVSIAGSKMKRNDVGLASWDGVLYNDGNSSGFSAVPSGSRYFSGTFAYSINHARHNSTWWQSEEDLSTNAKNALLCAVSDEDSAFRSVNVFSKKDALSVRCLKDD